MQHVLKNGVNFLVVYMMMMIIIIIIITIIIIIKSIVPSRNIGCL